MAKRKTKLDEINEKILFILDTSVFSLSISEITKALKKDYSLNVSPQIVKRQLMKLKKEGKIN